MGVLDEYNERIKEKVKRLEFMDGNDILSMDLRFIRRLADFGNPELVRRIVAKGDSKLQKKQILEKLKEVYQRDYWYEHASWSEHGYTEEQPWYFNDIAYDIATNTPLLPDEEKTLPNPNSSPSGEDGMGLLEARIAELEKENEALRQQLAPEEHCEEEEHCPEEGVLRNKVSFECFLQLLEQAGCDLNNTGNKNRAGALWRMMTGKSAHELRRYCSGRDYNNNHTKTDIARLDTLLSDLGITSLKLRQ